MLRCTGPGRPFPERMHRARRLAPVGRLPQRCRTRYDSINGWSKGRQVATDEQIEGYSLYVHKVIRHASMPYNLDRDELHQHLLIKAWIAIETFDESRGRTLHSWVVQCIKWGISEFLKAYNLDRKVRRSIDAGMSHFANVAAPEPEDQFARLNVVSELVEAVGNRRRRKILIDHHFRNLTIDKIADLELVSKQRISQIVIKGREEVRSCIECLSDEEKRAAGVLGMKL